MKRFLLSAVCFLLALQLLRAQAVSINTDGSTADPSAILDVKSTDKGMLVPRMTTAQRTAIATPATGLLVYDTSTGSFWFYNGTAWTNLVGSGGGGSYTAGPGISIVGSTISNTGDLIGADDITTANVAGGDLTGSFFNLQLAANAVGSSEIADGTVTAADLAFGVIPTTLPPNGPAGGDLSGTYPNPAVANGVITSAKIADGTVAAADLNQMGAASGQVMKWNGSAWAPANDIDTYYTYAAGTGLTLTGTTFAHADHSGDVTGATALTIANNAVTSAKIADGTVAAADLNQMGAASGQVLKWNGATWVPANDVDTYYTYDAGTGLTLSGTTFAHAAHSGDVTGTTALTIANNAVTSAKIADKTIAANDLNQMGAASGQVMQWNGSTWVPANNATTLLQDADNDTKVQVEKNADEDILRVDLAGSERLVLKRNAGAETMLELPNNSNNLFIGTGAGNANTTGANNVALGTAALYYNATRSDLVAVGDSALYNNGTGATGTQGTGNTGVGAGALFSNTIGQFNTATGTNAMRSNTTGYYNTASGYQTLYSNTTGYINTAIGYHALFSNISGNNNTAIGYRALSSNINGSLTVALGNSALLSHKSGNNNVAIGSSALSSDTTGYSNIAIGTSALGTNASGYNNVAIGNYALYYNRANFRSTAIGYGSMENADVRTTGRATYNTALGYYSLRGNVGTITKNTGQYNTAIGDEAMYSNASGSFNTALGQAALYADTSGDYNVALGHTALYSNLSGSNNVAVGFGALNKNTTRSDLVAVGDSALYNNGTGVTVSYQATGNTALGAGSLFANTTGYFNTATGHGALYSNIAGSSNTANGYRALYANNGSRNTAYGAQALYTNLSGIYNIAIGADAMYSNYSGYNNIGIGESALYSNKGNYRSTAIGDYAMQYADDRSTGQATYNTAIGNNALRGSTTPANNTGTQNTAVGDQALYSNSSGSGNTAVGVSALLDNTTGYGNNAIGFVALANNTTGNDNIAIGGYALYNNTNGSNNSAIGRNALLNNSTGSYNTSLGLAALIGTTTGNRNTGVGYLALYSNTTGSYNTALGDSANVSAGNLTNATAIGARAYVGASNSLVLGSINGTNGATSSVKVGIGVTAPTHYLTIYSSDTETMRLYSSGTNGAGSRLNFGDGDLVYIDEPTDDEMRIQANAVGIGRAPTTNRLEVEGAASKTTAGDWLANSDARLKKHIRPLNSQEMLQKMLALQGVSYEWNDDKTGSKRPEGIHYGFTAQNIRDVFPTLVEKDNLGYLQTAYGTYDAMTVEAIRALNDKINALQKENEQQKAVINRQQQQLDAQSAQLQQISAALQAAGIPVRQQ